MIVVELDSKLLSVDRFITRSRSTGVELIDEIVDRRLPSSLMPQLLKNLSPLLIGYDPEKCVKRAFRHSTQRSTPLIIKWGYFQTG